MILTCPNCGTQYVVKDDAVPPEGRQVRCAACKHSWHQDRESGPAAELERPGGTDSEQEAASAADAEHDQGDEDESLAEATLIDPRSGPESEERAYEEATIGGQAGAAAAEEALPVEASARDSEEADAVEASPAADGAAPPEAEAAPDMFTPFAPEDELEPRRRGPLTGILVFVLLIVVLAALFWFFAPANLKAKLGLAGTDSTPLQLVTTHMDRQHLESGNDLLTLTGRVINPSAKEQVVPPIQAQLKNKSGQVVYSWTIQPPAPSLAAGASASFNSAEVSVPPGGEELTITLGQATGRSS
jgi:predicted Zn finger-like uncharacterized protein